MFYCSALFSSVLLYLRPELVWYYFVYGIIGSARATKASIADLSGDLSLACGFLKATFFLMMLDRSAQQVASSVVSVFCPVPRAHPADETVRGGGIFRFPGVHCCIDYSFNFKLLLLDRGGWWHHVLNKCTRGALAATVSMLTPVKMFMWR